MITTTNKNNEAYRETQVKFCSFHLSLIVNANFMITEAHVC